VRCRISKYFSERYAAFLSENVFEHSLGPSGRCISLWRTAEDAASPPSASPDENFYYYFQPRPQAGYTASPSTSPQEMRYLPHLSTLLQYLRFPGYVTLLKLTDI
jgi:hypothetical protein